MEHSCNESITELKRVFEENDGVLNLLFFKFPVVVLLSSNHLCLSLVCKTLSVIKFRITILSLNSSLKVLVS